MPDGFLLGVIMLMVQILLGGITRLNRIRVKHYRMETDNRDFAAVKHGTMDGRI